MRVMATFPVWLLLAGCECGAPPRPPQRASETRGEEVAATHGPAVVLDDSIDVAEVRDFEVVDAALAAGAERARSWGGRAPGVARRSRGNWLCRLETHFGPPPEITATGFRYVLRERASGYVLTAFVDEGGPALGGVLRDPERPIDLERMTTLVDRLARLLDATAPAPCRLRLADGQAFGVLDGEWFE